MLNLMRKHAGSWMIKIILFIIVVVFVFWGVGNFRSRNDNVVADINGEIITLETYQQAYYQLLDNYRRIYGAQLNDDMLQLLRPNVTALEQLIQRVLILQEAERLDIDVSEEELKASIQQIPAFQNNGIFDYQRYQMVLSSNNIAAEKFEADRSMEIRMQRMQDIVLNGIAVTEDEARQWYNWNNARISLEYVLFAAADHTDIQLTDAEVADYFKANDQSYLTKPKVKVQYLRFASAHFMDDGAISDEKISDYYHGHPEEFKTQKRVNARHILLKLDPDADADTVAQRKAEALEISEAARAADADFAELARERSEGPSKDQGGELGWFTRDRMVKPFADQAFDMQPGEISDPVKTRFGWHIIKVEEVEAATTQPLETVADTIRARLSEKDAKDMAMDKAEEVYNSIFDGDDLAAAGKAHEVPVNITDFFAAGEFKDIGVAQPQKFAQTALKLEKMAISEIQDLGDAFYLLQVVERQNPVIPEMAAVTDQVRADLLKERQDQAAKADAEAFLKKVLEQGSLSGAGQGAKIMDTDLFARNGAIPNIGFDAQMSEAAFGLTQDKPLLEKAVKGPKGWYVIRLKDRQLPDESGFAKEKDNITQRLGDQKKQTALQAWLSDLRSRGEVEINESLIQP